MAAGERELSIGAVILPDTNPAAYVVIEGTGSPVSYAEVLLFDATTEESAYWQFRLPTGYGSSPVLTLGYSMVSATTGSVRFEALLVAITPGDSQDVDTKNFASTNSAGNTVAGTAGYLKEFTITLTNADSMAAGDYVRLLVRRDADGTTGTDDATGDCELRYVLISWS